MKYMSVCSGICAPTVAWKPLGWEALAFCEKDHFPSAVLAHRFPGVPNFGDMTKFKNWPDANILRPDALFGGTPCQSFSLAGLRKGLRDPRGNLMLTFAHIAAKYRPRWLVWENVPGVLSSNEGRDFASFLELITGQRVEVPKSGWRNSGILAGIPSAYGVAWRIIDAQHCGVPQRRRRIFLVGHLGDFRRAAAVLFERESMRGDSPPSRETGEGTACPPEGCAGRGSGTVATLDANYGRLHGCSGQDLKHNHSHIIVGTVSAKWAKGTGGPAGDECYNLIGVEQPEIAHPLRAQAQCSHRADLETFVPMVFDPNQITSPDNRSQPAPGNNCHSLTARGEPPAIIFSCKDTEVSLSEDVAPPLRAMGHNESHQNGGGQLAVVMRKAVRRLTPRECERLQGLPDDFTLIPYRGRPRKSADHRDTVRYLVEFGFTTEDAELVAKTPDGPRYKAIGNSIAVPVLIWIGQRMMIVDALPHQ